MLKRKLRNVRTVIWDGPLRVTEIPSFELGTKSVAETIVEHVPYSVVGGGDIGAALTRAGWAGRFTHCSTGGGASLIFLTDGDLPGLKALREEGFR